MLNNFRLRMLAALTIGMAFGWATATDNLPIIAPAPAPTQEPGYYCLDCNFEPYPSRKVRNALSFVSPVFGAGAIWLIVRFSNRSGRSSQRQRQDDLP